MPGWSAPKDAMPEKDGAFADLCEGVKKTGSDLLLSYSNTGMNRHRKIDGVGYGGVWERARGLV